MNAVSINTLPGDAWMFFYTNFYLQVAPVVPFTSKS